MNKDEFIEALKNQIKERDILIERYAETVNILLESIGTLKSVIPQKTVVNRS